MNRFVEAWNRYRERAALPDPPDSVQVDDEQLQFREEPPMEKTMPPQHFDTVVRWIKMQDVDRVNQLAVSIRAAMVRLRRRRRAGRAVAGTPEGSDQFNSGSIADWAANIQPCDTAAVDQLVVLDATIAARLGH